MLRNASRKPLKNRVPGEDQMNFRQITEDYYRKHVTNTANAFKKKMNRLLLLAVIVVVVIFITSVTLIVNNAYLLWFGFSPVVHYSRVMCSELEA